MSFGNFIFETGACLRFPARVNIRSDGDAWNLEFLLCLTLRYDAPYVASLNMPPTFPFIEYTDSTNVGYANNLSGRLPQSQTDLTGWKSYARFDTMLLESHHSA